MTDAEIMNKLASKISKELHVEESKAFPLIMVCAAFNEDVVKNAKVEGLMGKAIQIIVEDEDFMELKRRKQNADL